jgi:preprotein translocase subunit SecA
MINHHRNQKLNKIDNMKEGIGLRGYGQRDPLTEYKKEAFDMFQEMIGSLKETAVEQLFKVRMTREDAPATRVAQRAMPDWRESRGGDLDTPAPRPAARPEARAADGQKVGRNDPCPCGSGKKYKKCCLLKGA